KWLRACYLIASVTDSVTGMPLNNVVIDIPGIRLHDSTHYCPTNLCLNGIYKTGFADSGYYDITFSKNNYVAKTFQNVQLKNGVNTPLVVQMVKVSADVPVLTSSSDIIVLDNPAHSSFSILIGSDFLQQHPDLKLSLLDINGREIQTDQNRLQQNTFVKINFN